MVLRTRVARGGGDAFSSASQRLRALAAAEKHKKKARISRDRRALRGLHDSLQEQWRGEEEGARAAVRAMEAAFSQRYGSSALDYLLENEGDEERAEEDSDSSYERALSSEEEGEGGREWEEEGAVKHRRRVLEGQGQGERQPRGHRSVLDRYEQGKLSLGKGQGKGKMREKGKGEQIDGDDDHNSSKNDNDRNGDRNRDIHKHKGKNKGNHRDKENKKAMRRVSGGLLLSEREVTARRSSMSERTSAAYSGRGKSSRSSGIININKTNKICQDIEDIEDRDPFAVSASENGYDSSNEYADLFTANAKRTTTARGTGSSVSRAVNRNGHVLSAHSRYSQHSTERAQPNKNNNNNNNNMASAAGAGAYPSRPLAGAEDVGARRGPVGYLKSALKGKSPPAGLDVWEHVGGFVRALPAPQPQRSLSQLGLAHVGRHQAAILPLPPMPSRTQAFATTASNADNANTIESDKSDKIADSNNSSTAGSVDPSTGALQGADIVAGWDVPSVAARVRAVLPGKPNSRGGRLGSSSAGAVHFQQDTPDMQDMRGSGSDKAVKAGAPNHPYLLEEREREWGLRELAQLVQRAVQAAPEAVATAGETTQALEPPRSSKAQPSISSVNTAVGVAVAAQPPGEEFAELLEELWVEQQGERDVHGQWVRAAVEVAQAAASRARLALDVRYQSQHPGSNSNNRNVPDRRRQALSSLKRALGLLTALASHPRMAQDVLELVPVFLQQSHELLSQHLYALTADVYPADGSQSSHDNHADGHNNVLPSRLLPAAFWQGSSGKHSSLCAALLGARDNSSGSHEGALCLVLDFLRDQARGTLLSASFSFHVVCVVE